MKKTGLFLLLAAIVLGFSACEEKKVAVYDASLIVSDLQGASATLSKASGITATEEVTISVKPNGDNVWEVEPTIDVKNASLKKSSQTDNVFEFVITTFKGNAEITVVGNAKKAETYEIVLNTTNLIGATATLSKTAGIKTNDEVTLTVRPNTNFVWETAPQVTANHTVLQKKQTEYDTYTYVLSAFDGNAEITVVGNAKRTETYEIVLNTTNLIGATATLSKTAGIITNDVVTLTIQPNANFAWKTAPQVTANNAVLITQRTEDDTYIFVFSAFDGNVEMIISGVAVNGGAGTFEDPYTVATTKQDSSLAYVRGFIIGSYNFDNDPKFIVGTQNASNTSLLIAATADHTDTFNGIMAIQLPDNAVRVGLNLQANPGNLGKEIIVYGSLEKYCGINGVKNVTFAVLEGKEFGLKPGQTLTEPTSTPITVAEFNKAAVSTEVYYELTGTIGGEINDTYGNFDLTDETGTVYVYGLTETYLPFSNGKATNDKSYSKLNLKKGDKIVIRGTRGVYGEKIEVMGAYFVKKI